MMSNNTSIKQQEHNSEKQSAELPLSKSRTRIGTAWFMTVSFILGLVLLLIFILQNLRDIPIQFFSLHWKLPLGIAMLLAAVVGGFLVALFGIARVVQLGRRLRGNVS